jgi:hypothetical protein
MDAFRMMSTSAGSLPDDLGRGAANGGGAFKIGGADSVSADADVGGVVLVAGAVPPVAADRGANLSFGLSVGGVVPPTGGSAVGGGEGEAGATGGVEAGGGATAG